MLRNGVNFITQELVNVVKRTPRGIIINSANDTIEV